jgi:uncharacterized membrane protein
MSKKEEITMKEMRHEEHHQPVYKSFTTNVWVLLAVIAGATLFYLLTHHKNHVLEVLPYLLILAMILMHLGHGGHNHGGKNHE